MKIYFFHYNKGLYKKKVNNLKYRNITIARLKTFRVCKISCIFDSFCRNYLFLNININFLIQKYQINTQNI